MDVPNLFSYATSERSQDAFICWLLSWADPDVEEHNPALHATAQDFVDALVRPHGYDDTVPVSSINVDTQDKGIDVVAIINNEIALIIEDKVHASTHSNQLERYKTALAKKYGDLDLCPVYFKTGEQSHYRNVREAGYSLFLREDFLTVLDDGARRDPESDIFENYHRHLKDLDRRINSFANDPVGEWSRAGWKGFYQVLRDELGSGHWGYVPNQQGGFLGYYWHYRQVDGCEVYLQLEQETLCFKVKVQNESDYSRLRNQWHSRVVEASEHHPIDVVKPGRFGYGEHMTVAIYPDDYRTTDEGEVIDIQSTVERLKQAESLVEEVSSME